MSTNMKPAIVDLYPAKAQFLSGEPITAVANLRNPFAETEHLVLRVKTRYLNEIDDELEYRIDVPGGSSVDINIAIAAKAAEFSGFGLDACLFRQGKMIHSFSSAFDVVSDWRKAIRYGFLCDFRVVDGCGAQDIMSLCKLHINAVQFYDWIYRHDDYLPPSSKFTDPMGRELSMDAVKAKVETCRQHGMKAIAYGAVYAASAEFYNRHRDWALYDSAGNPCSMAEMFFIMNIAPESPWRRHIIGEYKKALTAAGFDGIHMDTYGFPKTAHARLDGKDRIVHLEDLFPGMIDATRTELAKVKDDVCLIFNAVGDWPVADVAAAAQDAVYIEVWEPYERYHHLQQLIKWARHLGKGKPVILAAYLKCFGDPDAAQRVSAEISALILTAVIAANGGCHLLLGEKNGVLTQGYYVNHASASDDFMKVIRMYYDFMVRYDNILFEKGLTDVSMTHTGGDNLEYEFGNGYFSTYGEPGKVWVIIRENPKYKTISLINLTGASDDRWNRGQEKPPVVRDINVRVQIEGKVKSVYQASPDFEMCRPQNLEYTITDGKRGKVVLARIPMLYVWDLLVVEME